MRRVLLKRKLAGQSELGRTSFFAEPSKPYLVDIIEFIYTPLWKSKTFLVDQYIKNGHSITQIAAETLSSKSTIRRALMEFKIPIRSIGKPGLRPAQAPYGYRRQNGLLVPHLGEQRVIEAVKKRCLLMGCLTARSVTF